MRFQILGPLEVADANGTLDVGAGKQRALLALLILHANEVVSVDRLVDELWGEDPPPTAAKIVQNYVSRLRKSLDGQVLLTRGHGYELRVEEGELDADRFERLFDDARRALARGDLQTAGETLRQALAMWRGPPLSEFTFDAFAQADIARLEERRLAAVEERIDADLALGRHADVVAEIEALIATHPLRERLHAALMLGLYRSGRQAEALQVYQDARRALVEQLGVEPGPALQQLQRAILEHDPSLGPVAAQLPVPPRPGPRSHRRRGLLPGAVAVLLAAVVAVVIVDRDSGDDAASIAAAGNSLAVVDPATDRIVADIPVGRTPAGVAVGEDAVWTLNADDQTITRFNPANKVVDTFGTGSAPTALAAGAGALWTATAGAGRAPGHYDAPQKEVARLDPGSTRVVTQIALPPESAANVGVPPTGVVVGGGAVWALAAGGGVIRINPETNLVATKVRGLRAKALAYGNDALWVLTRTNAVARVDPRRSVVTKRIKVAATGLDAIAAGAGAVWAADGADGTLWRLDTGGPQVVSRTIPMDQGLNGVAIGLGSVWAINGLQGTLARIDPGTNRVSRTIAVGNTPSAVAVGLNRVWVAVRGVGGGVLPAVGAPRGTQRIDPLPASVCGLLAGSQRPDLLVASDFPLQGVGWHRALAGAVAFVLRQHGFRAGRFRVAYQSCDDSTPTSGGSDPGKCTSNAKLLAADRAVVGVIGPLESSCAALEIPILNRAAPGPLALISPTSSLPSLTRRDRFAFPPGAPAALYPTGVRNFARVYPRDDQQAAAQVLLARDLGLHCVFVLDDREPYGQGMASHFRATARRLGLGLSGSASWDPFGHGLAPLARRVRQAHADGVFLGGLLSSSGGGLVRALRKRLGPRVALMAPDAFAPVWALWDQAGTAARGLYIAAGGIPNERLGPAGRRFVQEFGGTQPRGVVGAPAVATAAATDAMLAAIARSDGTRASVTRELLRTRLPDSVLGSVAFDRYGDTTNPAVMVLRVERRENVSDIEGFDGAAVERVIQPATH